MEKSAFLDIIRKKIPKYTNWTTNKSPDNIVIYTGFSGLQMSIGLENEIPELYFYERTTSSDFDGDRSDIHDVVSILLAVFLKLNHDISCSIFDVPHPAIETSCEIYARYILIQQFDKAFYKSDLDTVEKIVEVIVGLSVFEIFFWQAVGCPCDDCRKESKPPFDYREEFEDDWPNEVQKVLATKSSKVRSIARCLPTWNYYKNYTTRTSIILCPNLCTFFSLQVTKKANALKTVSGISGELVVSENCFNFTPFTVKNKSIKAISSLDGINEKRLSVIQLDNTLAVIGNNHILFQESMGGLFNFNEEKEKVRVRHLDENEFLFKPTSISWGKDIDGGKFENLIKDLLEREPGVNWVRKVSHTNEQDGGRDLIVEWRTPPLTNETVKENESPYRNRKIIVQCKASNMGLGKSNVNDVRDTIEHFGYDGYFLAVSSYTKRNLTDALDKIKNDGKFWINWWTRHEIEARLSRHKDLIDKYPTIVSSS